jgi:hypothetical protein
VAKSQPSMTLRAVQNPREKRTWEVSVEVHGLPGVVPSGTVEFTTNYPKSGSYFRVEQLKPLGFDSNGIAYATIGVYALEDGRYSASVRYAGDENYLAASAGPDSWAAP